MSAPPRKRRPWPRPSGRSRDKGHPACNHGQCGGDLVRTCRPFRRNASVGDSRPDLAKTLGESRDRAQRQPHGVARDTRRMSRRSAAPSRVLLRQLRRRVHLPGRVEPRRCAFNGDKVHARQVLLRKMRWRSWGGRTACGRGEFFYNQGCRAPARFCLYRPVDDGGVMSTRESRRSRPRLCPRCRVWPRQADSLQLRGPVHPRKPASGAGPASVHRVLHMLADSVLA
jgi:hypothetical protein